MIMLEMLQQDQANRTGTLAAASATSIANIMMETQLPPKITEYLNMGSTREGVMILPYLRYALRRTDLE
jgi:hypothetical protein